MQQGESPAFYYLTNFFSYGFTITKDVMQKKNRQNFCPDDSCAFAYGST